MKYAKKFKLVPYSAETPASTQINAALTNSLRMPTIPEQRVKIYNTALTKLKELQDENQIKPVLNTNYEIEHNDEDISKEISDLEKQTIQNKASENLKDYSKSDKLNEVKIKRKKKFDNEKFDILLNKLTQDSQTLSTIGKDIITNNQNIQTKFGEFENLLNSVFNNQREVDTFKYSTPGINNWNFSGIKSRLSEPSLRSRRSQSSIQINDNAQTINSEYHTLGSDKSENLSDKSLNLSETINNDSPRTSRALSNTPIKSNTSTKKIKQPKVLLDKLDQSQLDKFNQSIANKLNQSKANKLNQSKANKLNQSRSQFYTPVITPDDYEDNKPRTPYNNKLRKYSNSIIPKGPTNRGAPKNPFI